ncbi:MAG: rRNA pseudouridine synthase [Gemmatimonadetes bacterium]|nr:rRNA pseudouridine synthase [Gemmatimonadota bacterium]
MRLQKFLAQAGVASRRRAEDLIAAGLVTVNGDTVTIPGTKVDPTDLVAVDGKTVQVRVTEWLALHKPRGFVSTRRDPQGRRTLYELLPPELRHLFSVGRLDADSEGLILLTNNGDAAHRMLHPRYQVEREYEVEVAGRLDRSERDRLLAGVPLDDGIARAVRGTRSGAHTLRLTLREGRKREVRRMLAALGHPVRRLRRIRYGAVELGDLPPGGWRRLEAHELPPRDDSPAGGNPTG